MDFSNLVNISLISCIIVIALFLLIVWLFIYSAIKEGTKKAIIEAHETIKKQEQFKHITSYKKTNGTSENKIPML